MFFYIILFISLYFFIDFISSFFILGINFPKSSYRPLSLPHRLPVFWGFHFICVFPHISFGTSLTPTPFAILQPQPLQITAKNGRYKHSAREWHHFSKGHNKVE